MNLLIRGDKIKVTDAMNDYVKDKLQKLNKYIEDSENVRATIVVKIKDHRQKVEVTIPLKTFILRAEEERDDFYAAVDTIVDKLERQIRKNKTRLENKVPKATRDFVFTDMEEEIESNDTAVVKRKKIEVKPMDEEEAILQLELLGHQFYLYKDAVSNQPTVIYKRKDGGYGIIEQE